jgi:hypothetical protein
MSYKINDNK